MNFCFHQDNIYIADGQRLTRWKPGSQDGREIILVRDNLVDTTVAVAPCGQIFLADAPNERLLTLEDGQLTEVLRRPGLRSVCVTSTGTIYLLGCASHNIGWLVRLEGDKVVHVINSRDLLPKFHCNSAFVRMFAQGEVLYILGWHMEDDSPIDFIVKVPPDGSEPVIVGRGYESSTDLRSVLLCCIFTLRRGLTVARINLFFLNYTTCESLSMIPAHILKIERCSRATKLPSMFEVGMAGSKYPWTCPGNRFPAPKGL